jgi:hypothetical protein
MYESPDKDGFSTSSWSRDYTGKWMDPRHEMIGILFDFIRNSRWVDFQQGLLDLDTLDPRDKHLIILDDLMNETAQRVASPKRVTKKDGFSTSGWSRDHTGKWMDPRHEMVWIVFIGNVKCVRIVGLYHVIRFFCLPLYFVLVWKESILLLLLLYSYTISSI